MTPVVTDPRSELARATMGVLAIVTLIGLTIWVLRPFLAATIWAAMIVIATWPVMLRLQGWFRGSRAAATAAMTVALLLLLVIPLTLVIGTVAANADTVIQWAASLRTLTIPPPPEWLANVPLVGGPLSDGWIRLAQSQLADLATSAAPYVATSVLWVAGTLRGFGVLLLQFLLTVAIAGVMYMNGEYAADALVRFGRRLAGDQGTSVILLAGQAIRAVALGIVVSALLQSGLAGIGLVLAGIPFAPLLTALSLVLCIAQIGPSLVLFPAVAWLFYTGATGTGTFLLVWSLIVVTMDNVVRPFLMKKGLDVPLLLMLSGVIGGLVAFGLVGIFVGPVVLAVTYTLVGAWIAAVPPGEGIDQLAESIPASLD